MQNLIGQDLHDREGHKVGGITQVYEDTQTGKPEWAAVSTGFFGSKVAVVPLTQATTKGDELVVPFEKSHIKDAPHIDADHEITQSEESALYAHYGLDYGDTSADTRTDADTTTGEAMTRSEEEIAVGKREVETGRARLRKYIVTEEVQTTVPVQREEVVLEREPITDGNADRALDGPELTESEHEVVLHEEVPVVEKTTVPKERVRLDKATSVGEAKVSEQARKEQIEVEGVDETANRR